MNRFISFVIILMLLGFIPLFAQSLYIGGSVGSSFQKTKPQEVGGEEFVFNKNGFAYKAYAGFRLAQFLGIEGGYRNLGKVKDTILDTEFESNTKGFDVFATGTLNLATIDVFAKAGYFFWNTEVSTGEISIEDDDKDFAWGVGAALNLGNFKVRAEWEQFNAGDMENLSMFTAGIAVSLF